MMTAAIKITPLFHFVDIKIYRWPALDLQRWTAPWGHRFSGRLLAAIGVP
jgi:hypothetical protein